MIDDVCTIGMSSLCYQEEYIWLFALHSLEDPVSICLEHDFCSKVFHLHFICLPFIPFNYWNDFTHVILPKVYYYGVGLAECLHSYS
jgi:hypothetical protein